jgi:hypothetical protein
VPYLVAPCPIVPPALAMVVGVPKEKWVCRRRSTHRGATAPDLHVQGGNHPNTAAAWVVSTGSRALERQTPFETVWRKAGTIQTVANSDIYLESLSREGSRNVDESQSISVDYLPAYAVQNKLLATVYMNSSRSNANQGLLTALCLDDFSHLLGRRRSYPCFLHIQQYRCAESLLAIYARCL